ncbi:hypothetical protein NQ317_001724 [Molorchus minor]|uniref:Arrestin-like N-terminal domain-containing protein n=1 Tax=Molorchus minor TaxID=1323400 RepID=A0ABQ9IXQ7_9CUCU|nr:hypothetical protein NQ317_001724 [Molorchus minor]
MSSCVIRLDNQEGHYLAGQAIKGMVVCEFIHSKKITGIFLKLMGKEQTRWVDHDIHDCNTEYTGENTVLEIDVILNSAGKDKSHPNILSCACGEIEIGDVHPGHYEYPFLINLPDDIPSTYHGKHGWIIFFLHAAVERLHKHEHKHNLEDQVEIKIVVPKKLTWSHLFLLNKMAHVYARPHHMLQTEEEVLDIVEDDPSTSNREIARQEPKTYTDSVNIDMEKMIMNVHLNKEVFVVGESDRVRVEILNRSAANVERVEFKMELNPKALHPGVECQYQYEVLGSDVETGVEPFSEKTYEFKLNIDGDLVLPNFSLCKLFLQMVTGVVLDCSRNLEIKHGVLIGTCYASEEEVQLKGSNRGKLYLDSKRPVLCNVPRERPTSSTTYFPGKRLESGGPHIPKSPPKEFPPKKRRTESEDDGNFAMEGSLL